MTHSSIVFSWVSLLRLIVFFLAGGCKNYIKFDMYSSLLFKSYVMWVEYGPSNALFQMQSFKWHSEQRNFFYTMISVLIIYTHVNKRTFPWNYKNSYQVSNVPQILLFSTLFICLNNFPTKTLHNSLPPQQEMNKSLYFFNYAAHAIPKTSALGVG